MGLGDPSDGPDEEIIAEEGRQMSSEEVYHKLSQLSDTASRHLLKEVAIQLCVLKVCRPERFKSLLMTEWLNDI